MHAREWAYSKGMESANEYSEEYRRHYSLREQALIKKLLRTMLFANYCGNSYYKRPWKKEEKIDVCKVEYAVQEKTEN